MLPDIEILRYRSSHVLAIRVYPGSNRPHYLGSEPATGVFVRVGSTNRHADEELIAEMRRFSLGQSFDERPMPDLDSEAIDFRAASESFAEFRKLAQRDLEILRLCTTYQGRSVPIAGNTPATSSDDPAAGALSRMMVSSLIERLESMRETSSTEPGKPDLPTDGVSTPHGIPT